MKDPFGDQTTIARPGLALLISYPFELKVVVGPDVGVSLSVDADKPTRVLIGKSPVCEMRLTDASVSRRHAAVEVTDDHLRLTDLDSTNGTYVNGILVREVFLTGGETIRIGESQLRVVRGEPVPQQRTTQASSFGAMWGASDAMRRLYPLCQRLAAADVPLIIEGETGVGKEQLARAIHQQSARAKQAFVVFDCTAVAPSLIESELFGHAHGAFTGTVGAHEGVFQRADGGTLLIDEIGDLPLPLQPKLLRAAERLEVQPIGGRVPIRVNVRVMAATRRDLDREVHLGRFRDDLFHRLAIARVELPPLRERRGDVALLARLFCEELGGDPGSLPDELLQSWDDYRWPGNVRELRNAVARRIALGDLYDLMPAAATIGQAGSSAVHRGGDAVAAILALGMPYSDARKRMLAEFDERFVDHMLVVHQGNVTRAAAAAGVGRRYFQRIKAKGKGSD